MKIDQHMLVLVLLVRDNGDIGSSVQRTSGCNYQALFDGARRGAELQSVNGTAYGLLNSVTEFVDHMRRARGAGYRLESAWLGQGAALKQKALDQSLALIV